VGITRVICAVRKDVDVSLLCVMCCYVCSTGAQGFPCCLTSYVVEWFVCVDVDIQCNNISKINNT
jgi:hypothetical protein